MTFNHQADNVFEAVGVTREEYGAFRQNFVTTVNKAGEIEEPLQSRSIEAGYRFVEQQGDKALLLTVLFLIEALMPK